MRLGVWIPHQDNVYVSPGIWWIVDDPSSPLEDDWWGGFDLSVDVKSGPSTPACSGGVISIIPGKISDLGSVFPLGFEGLQVSICEFDSVNAIVRYLFTGSVSRYTTDGAIGRIELVGLQQSRGNTLSQPLNGDRWIPAIFGANEFALYVNDGVSFVPTPSLADLRCSVYALYDHRFLYMWPIQGAGSPYSFVERWPEYLGVVAGPGAGEYYECGSVRSIVDGGKNALQCSSNSAVMQDKNGEHSIVEIDPAVGGIFDPTTGSTIGFFDLQGRWVTDSQATSTGADRFAIVDGQYQQVMGLSINSVGMIRDVVATDGKMMAGQYSPVTITPNVDVSPGAMQSFIGDAYGTVSHIGNGWWYDQGSPGGPAGGIADFSPAPVPDFSNLSNRDYADTSVLSLTSPQVTKCGMSWSGKLSGLPAGVRGIAVTAEVFNNGSSTPGLSTTTVRMCIDIASPQEEWGESPALSLWDSGAITVYPESTESVFFRCMPDGYWRANGPDTSDGVFRVTSGDRTPGTGYTKRGYNNFIFDTDIPDGWDGDVYLTISVFNENTTTQMPNNVTITLTEVVAITEADGVELSSDVYGPANGRLSSNWGEAFGSVLSGQKYRIASAIDTSANRGGTGALTGGTSLSRQLKTAEELKTEYALRELSRESWSIYCPSADGTDQVFGIADAFDPFASGRIDISIPFDAKFVGAREGDPETVFATVALQYDYEAGTEQYGRSITITNTTEAAYLPEYVSGVSDANEAEKLWWLLRSVAIASGSTAPLDDDRRKLRWTHTEADAIAYLQACIDWAGAVVSSQYTPPRLATMEMPLHIVTTLGIWVGSLVRVYAPASADMPEMYGVVTGLRLDAEEGVYTVTAWCRDVDNTITETGSNTDTITETGAQTDTITEGA